MGVRQFAAVLLSSACALASASEPVVDRPAWGKYFADTGVTGTIVVVDERKTPAPMFVFDRERAARRYSPASTYKIPHTLFAQDAGAVADEFQVFKWDGVKRSFAGHNQDQTLRSAMRYSTLWVYEGFARQIGEPKARAYLRGIDYGNADPATSKGAYWVDGNLRISALEQVAFLRKLYRNALPFKVEHHFFGDSGRDVPQIAITKHLRRLIQRGVCRFSADVGDEVHYVTALECVVIAMLERNTSASMFAASCSAR